MSIWVLKITVKELICFTFSQLFGYNFTLKVELWLSEKNCFIYLNERPLKMMKNAFYFTSKALFVLKIFLLWLFGRIKKMAWLERLISKFMASQPGLQKIIIHILPNISQSKDNQTMKFGQLIEYNKRNIFL